MVRIITTTVHRHHREVISIGLVTTTAMGLLLPSLSPHCAVAGLAVNLLWVWD